MERILRIIAQAETANASRKIDQLIAKERVIEKATKDIAREEKLRSKISTDGWSATTRAIDRAYIANQKFVNATKALSQNERDRKFYQLFDGGKGGKLDNPFTGQEGKGGVAEMGMMASFMSKFAQSAPAIGVAIGGLIMLPGMIGSLTMFADGISKLKSGILSMGTNAFSPVSGAIDEAIKRVGSSVASLSETVFGNTPRMAALTSSVDELMRKFGALAIVALPSVIAGLTAITDAAIGWAKIAVGIVDAFLPNTPLTDAINAIELEIAERAAYQKAVDRLHPEPGQEVREKLSTLDDDATQSQRLEDIDSRYKKATLGPKPSRYDIGRLVDGALGQGY